MHCVSRETQCLVTHETVLFASRQQAKYKINSNYPAIHETRNYRTTFGMYFIEAYFSRGTIRTATTSISHSPS